MSPLNTKNYSRVILKRILPLALLGSILVLGTVKFFYGTGRFYPGVSTSPFLDESKLSTLVELPFPPGNITVSQSKRVFFNYHPFAKAERFSEGTLFELLDGKPIAFPDIKAKKNYKAFSVLRSMFSSVCGLSSQRDLIFQIRL